MKGKIFEKLLHNILLKMKQELPSPHSIFPFHIGFVFNLLTLKFLVYVEAINEQKIK